jgi:four helix bundle protein
MPPLDLLERLHLQAINALTLSAALPDRVECRDVRAQLARCAPSARDNYRSARRGRSRKEWVSRLAVALDEADETVGWLETIRDARLAPSACVDPLLKEAIELRAILSSSLKTSRRNLKLLEEKRKRERRRRPQDQ